MEGYIGEIRMFAGSFPPQYWAFCEGQLFPINQNQSLFSIIGTRFGGDGRTNFALPDLRERAVLGAGAGPGLSPRTLGQAGGSNSVALNENQLPNHTHQTNVVNRGAHANTAVNGSGTAGTPQSGFNVAVATDANGDAVKAYASSGTPISKPASGTLTINVGYAGGNQPHENRPPSLAMHPIICVSGYFPSRQ